MGVHLSPCGHTWRGGPRDQQDAPRAPALRSLQMDPLVPSPESCSGPVERCFLRQPWLRWPLQLEHPGGGGERNEVGAGPRGTPAPLSGLTFSTDQAEALELGWTAQSSPRPGQKSSPRAPPPRVGPGFGQAGWKGFFPGTPADDPRPMGPRWE